jgi:glycosyltransferase involved in cell wall biosynthesis
MATDLSEQLGAKLAPVSAVIKAKNEAHQIADCVASLKGFAAEIIVVDDASTDGTADLAERCGARVIRAKSVRREINEMDKIGFVAATQAWTLRFDADERMTPGLAQALREVIDQGQYKGVLYARKQIMFGAWAKYGSWFRVSQLRFFRTDAWDRSWDYRILHPNLPVEGPILNLPCREDCASIHLDYDRVEEYVHRTLWNYSLNEAEVAFKLGQTFSGWRLLAVPARRFLANLIYHQGFRDGWRGVILAGLTAAYDFCIEANLWDLERQAGKRN